MKKRKIISLLLIVTLLLNSAAFINAAESIIETEEKYMQLDTIISEKVIEADLSKYIEFSKQLSTSAATRSSRYYYPTKYFQNGELWSGDYMESKHKTIGGYGCALTSFAMLVSLNNYSDDPGEVNQVMGSNACNFAWDAAETNYNLEQYRVSWSTLSETTAEGAIAGILEEEGLCIVGMFKGDKTHFVLARGYNTGVGSIGIRIYDPESSRDYSYLQSYFDAGWSVNRLVFFTDYTM